MHSARFPRVVLAFAAALAICFLPGCFKTPGEHAQIAKSEGRDISQEKRLASVRALDDQTLLADVAANTADAVVRGAAVDKLADEPLLARVAASTKDTAVRNAAIDKLTDEQLLARLAKNVESWEVREKIIDKLTDSQALTVIAIGDLPERFRMQAIEKLADEKMLTFIAVDASKRGRKNKRVVRAAVDRLTDQTLLATVANNVSSNDIPAEAFSKLTDQRQLAALAMHTKDDKMRIFAVEKLTDQPSLEAIAQSKNEVSFREIAVYKLTNQQLLAGIIADKDESLRIQAAAIHRLADQGLLADIARKATDDDIGLFAVEKLNDRQLLAELVEKHTPFASRQWYVHQFAKIRLAELQLLARITGGDTTANISAATLEQLTDQQLLADISTSTFGNDLRMTAVKKLTDQRLLAGVAGTLRAGGEVRLAAAERLTDQQLLSEIAQSPDDSRAVEDERERRLFRHRMRPHLWVVMRTNHYAWWSIYRTAPELGWSWGSVGYRNVHKGDWWEALSISKIRKESAAIRETAVRRLTNPRLLADVAKNAANAEMRSLAMQKLDDPQLLADIAKNDRDSAVVWAALEKLTPDAQILADLARAANTDVRLWAVWRTTDKSLLLELSQKDADARVRKAAAEQLSDNSQSVVEGNIMSLAEEGRVLLEIDMPPRHSSPFMHVRAKFMKTVPGPLEIFIPSGSYFVSGNPACRNMVSPKKTGAKPPFSISVKMTDDAAIAYGGISVAYTNRAAYKNQPGGFTEEAAWRAYLRGDINSMYGRSIRYTPARLPNAHEMGKLMASVDNMKYINHDAFQSAIWIVADNADYNGLAAERISVDNVTHAMQLCDEAGIDIKKKKIWNDRDKILKDLSRNKDLKNWLENL